MVDDAAARALASEQGDFALVARLREGDRTAFDETYATHQRRIFAFLLRLSGRRDTAEDLAQETWLKLARAAPTLREDTKIAALLFTIARNSFLSYRRWAVLDLSRIVTLGIEAMSEATTDAPDPEALGEHAQTIARLEAALQAIPLASREILLLVGVEGMDQEEVARILGLSYDAVRQRLHRARGQLADAMHSSPIEKKTTKLAAAERRRTT